MNSLKSIIPAEIDEKAPVIFHAEIAIAAPPAIVWAVLTDIGKWPVWAEMIDTAELGGPLVAGTIIHWTTSGMTINSRLTRVEVGEALDWDGSDGGIRGLHSWRLEATEFGTLVWNSESMSGGFADQSPAKVRELLVLMLETWNQRLKTEAERIAGLQG